MGNAGKQGEVFPPGFILLGCLMQIIHPPTHTSIHTGPVTYIAAGGSEKLQAECHTREVYVCALG